MIGSQLHSSMLWKLSYHDNKTETLITSLSYMSLSFTLTSYLVQSFMDQQISMVIKVSLWLPWGPSYHSNKICDSCLLFQETWMPNINSI